MGLVYHSCMSNVDDVKDVMVSIDKELWKDAKVLAAKQERPVRLVVADALRFMVDADQRGTHWFFDPDLADESSTK